MTKKQGTPTSQGRCVNQWLRFRFLFLGAFVALGLVLAATNAIVRADFFDDDDGGWGNWSDTGNSNNSDYHGGWNDENGWGDYTNSLNNQNGGLDFEQEYYNNCGDNCSNYIDYNDNSWGEWDSDDWEDTDDWEDDDWDDLFWGEGDGDDYDWTTCDDDCDDLPNITEDFPVPEDFTDADGDGTADYLNEVDEALWSLIDEDEDNPFEFLGIDDGDPLRDSYRINDIWAEYTGNATDPMSDREALMWGDLLNPTIVGGQTAREYAQLRDAGQRIDFTVLDEIINKNPSLVNANGEYDMRTLANLMMNREFTNQDGGMNFNRIAHLLEPYFSGLFNGDGTANTNRILNTLSANNLPPGLSSLATTGGGGSGGGSVAIPSISPNRPTGVPDDIWGIVANMFNFAISVSSVIFTVLLLIGGLMYLGSAGDEGNVTKAKNLMLAAIIGLGIVLAAWTVSNFILTKLQAPTRLSSLHLLIDKTG